MIKLLGAILVITACTLIGFEVANKYKLRPLQLRALRSLLNLLEAEIVYLSTPLPLALEKVARYASAPLNSLFIMARDELLSGDGITAGEAWVKAVDSFQDKSCLDEEDLNILRQFGAGLGGSDKDEQIKNIQLTKELLKQQEWKADEKRYKNERMWRSMGFLSGLAIVLILL